MTEIVLKREDFENDLIMVLAKHKFIAEERIGAVNEAHVEIGGGKLPLVTVKLIGSQIKIQKVENEKPTEKTEAPTTA